MTALDATGLHALEVFAERMRKTGRTLLLCGARDQPAELLSQANVVGDIGRENILPNVDAALRRAREISGSFSGVGLEIADDMQSMTI